MLSFFKKKKILSGPESNTRKNKGNYVNEPLSMNAPAGTVEISREKNGNHKYTTLRNEGKVYYRYFTADGKEKFIKSGRGKQFELGNGKLLGRYTRKENSNAYNAWIAKFQAKWNAARKKIQEELNAKQKRIQNAKEGPPQGYEEVKEEKNATHFQYQNHITNNISIEKMPNYSNADNSYQGRYSAIQLLHSFREKQKSPFFRYLKKISNQQGGKTRKQKKSRLNKTRKH